MRTFAQRPKATQQTKTAKSTKAGRAFSGQSHDVHSILRLQRTIKNQAMQRLVKAKTDELEAGSVSNASTHFALDFSRIPVPPATTTVVAQDGGNAALSNIHATRGLKSGVVEDEIIRGRTVGEFIGDVARPVGTALGNVGGSVAGALTGISISSTTNAGPTWNNHGACVWHVGFNTTGRSGWIVQDIVNNWRAKDAAGSAVPSPLTPHFLEAWAVDAAGNVTPSVGADNDYWDNPDLKATTGAVEGHWATKGKLYFTTTDPATQGFIRHNPATNAGMLLSSTAAPAGLGIGIARLHRYAQGTWDSTGAVPTHTGSAGP
jgi:hypothetical protein